MPKKSKVNVKLLRRIKKHILEEPRRFMMSTLRDVGYPGSTVPCRSWDQADKYPACGTTACIAGWAIELDGKAKNGKYYGQGNLGLTEIQAFRLLFNFNWPEPFQQDYKNTKTPKARAQIAGKRIDHFIKTGK